MIGCPACTAAGYLGRAACRRHRRDPRKAVRRCSVQGCAGAMHARELCLRHYMRWWELTRRAEVTT